MTVLAVPLSSPVPAARSTITGHSVLGRPIVARRLGDSRHGPTVLVIGAIHGNEPAGIAIVRRLERTSQSRHERLWVIEDLNPDGVRADTRTNAHGVDLNRNFPWRWRHGGAPRSPYYQGPSPLSEPESRFARRVILQLRPDVTIWFHQHLTVVDSSSGNTAIEDRFADRVGLPLGRLSRYGGSATTWQSHRFPKTTAFVVELPLGALRARAARVYARAVLALARPR